MQTNADPQKQWLGVKSVHIAISNSAILVRCQHIRHMSQPLLLGKCRQLELKA